MTGSGHRVAGAAEQQSHAIHCKQKEKLDIISRGTSKRIQDPDIQQMRNKSLGNKRARVS